MAYAWEPSVIHVAARQVLTESGRYGEADSAAMEHEVLNLSAILLAAGRKPLSEWSEDVVVSRFVAWYQPSEADIRHLRSLLMRGSDDQA